MRATATGSLPGDDMTEAVRIVLDIFADALPFVPELPARGVHATMIARTIALIDLPIDLQPAGWRIAGGSGRDQSRARSLLSHDLDVLEERWADREGSIKQQLAGPLTLAATLEKLRGDKLVADPGARRDVADALAEAVRDHVVDLRRRLGNRVIIQIDEPAARAVLDGAVPTMSGFGKHRSVGSSEADGLWRRVTDAAREAGAHPVVHSCSSDVPVALLAGAGFAGIAVDLALAEPNDEWAEAIESGIEPWWGSSDPRAIERFAGRLGFSLESLAPALVVTTACGLAGSTEFESRTALESTVRTARALVP